MNKLIKKALSTLVATLFLATILAGCTNVKNYKVSINKFFEYKTPQNWTDSNTFSDFAEISIKEEEGNSWFLMEYQDGDIFTPEDFLDTQRSLLEEEQDVKFLEKKDGKAGNKVIETAIYGLKDDSAPVKFIFGTIQFNQEKNFLGFVGLLDKEDKENGLNEFFSTIKRTKKNMADATHFVAEKDYIELDLPAGWKRVNGTVENYFYKIIKNGNLQLRINIMDNDLVNVNTFFDKEIKDFESAVPGLTLKSEDTQEENNKTITNKTYTYTQENKPIYISFNLISDKNSSLSIVANFKLDVKDDFETFKKETDEMVKSLKLKKDGEKKFKEDFEKFQKNIEDYNKSLEESQKESEQTTLTNESETSEETTK